MFGLLTKDIHILLIRRQSLILFLIICLVMGYSMDGSFIVGYMTFLGLILAASTYSYDEAENGLTYLMTLPFSRRTYVLSKYVFCIGMEIITWLMSVVVMIACSQLKNLPFPGNDEWMAVLAILPITIILFSIMLPLQIRFGAEKSRLVLFVIFGIIAAVVTFTQIGNSIESLPPVSDAMLLILFFVLAVIGSGISFLFSCRILEHKDL